MEVISKHSLRRTRLFLLNSDLDILKILCVKMIGLRKRQWNVAMSSLPLLRCHASCHEHLATKAKKVGIILKEKL